MTTAPAQSSSPRPFSLEAIADQAVSGSVMLRGVEYTVRPLTDLELQLIVDTFPQPRTPLVKDPAAGSKAPKVPDAQDPGYRAAMREWTRQVEAGQAALALRHSVGGREPYPGTADADAFRGWCAAAAGELRATLHMDELSRVVRAADALVAAGGDPAGNS